LAYLRRFLKGILQMFINLRQFIAALQQKNQLQIVDRPVDPHLEIAEIHRRVIAAEGPALLFTKVKGKSFPVLTNLFGSKERVDMAFSDQPKELVRGMLALAEEIMPPTCSKLWQNKKLLWQLTKLGQRSVSRAPVLAYEIPGADLTCLPALTSWEEDGGPFLTLPLVHTASPRGHGENLAIYRMQIFSREEAGMHWQIGKGGGYHYFEAEKLQQALPVNIYLGGPPALILAAIAPLPENAPELMLASLLLGKRIARSRSSAAAISPLAEAEFVIQGLVPPNIRRDEGPFGDHYGYYSLTHPYPLMRPQKIFHRKDAIFPATIVGKPRQEDYYLGNYLQELLSPILPLLVPALKGLWSYGETGFHALTSACIEERYPREALTTVFRVLGEGQLSLTKFLLVVDNPAVDLQDIKAVLSYILARVDWQQDLRIFSQLAMDSLDYSGVAINQGGKGVLLGLGEIRRDLPREFSGRVSNPLVRRVKSFCPGCLVVEVPSFADDRDCVKDLSRLPEFAEWQLLIAVDNLEKTLKSSSSFLWTTFTRFEPSLDIYAQQTELRKHQVSYCGPIVIDARMKSWYPKELFCDETTRKLVEDQWLEYFPSGRVVMGPSDEVSDEGKNT
jgi:UbiD family decarboxylase